MPIGFGSACGGGSTAWAAFAGADVESGAARTPNLGRRARAGHRLVHVVEGSRWSRSRLCDGQSRSMGDRRTGSASRRRDQGQQSRHGAVVRPNHMHRIGWRAMVLRRGRPARSRMAGAGDCKRQRHPRLTSRFLGKDVAKPGQKSRISEHPKASLLDLDSD